MYYSRINIETVHLVGFTIEIRTSVFSYCLQLLFEIMFGLLNVQRISFVIRGGGGDGGG